MIWAVIMAGGQGTRFWPLSTAERPKQLLPIATERTMLEETVNRLRGFIPLDRTLIVTNAHQARAVRTLFPRLKKSNVIAEPCGRSTAPCIGLAAHILLIRDPKAIMVALPADHMISKTGAFRSILRKAAHLAEKPGVHVTLGIRPTFPATGYGYIESGRAAGASVFKVKRFVEKPALPRAKAMLRTGRFSWNSGMFVWRADTVLDSIAKHIPKLSKGLRRIAARIGTSEFPRTLGRLFPLLPSISVDYGVMEKTSRAVVIRSGFGWNDVGSWEAAAGFWPKDKFGNAVKAPLIAVDARNNAVLSENGKVVACVGVSNLTIVATSGGVLVCDTSRAQDVRKIPDMLKSIKRKKR